jgi:hypothetical protein
MDSIKPNSKGATYLEVYETEIAPQLEDLDITLKSMDEPITPAEASKALYISDEELYEIMSRLNINVIDQTAFLKLMKEASSPVCRMYQRELAVGSPYVYSQEDIAYIYELPIEAVNQACDDLGLKQLTAYTLPDLFSCVYQPVSQWGSKIG